MTLQEEIVAEDKKAMLGAEVEVLVESRNRASFKRPDAMLEKSDLLR